MLTCRRMFQTLGNVKCTTASVLAVILALYAGHWLSSHPAAVQRLGNSSGCPGWASENVRTLRGGEESVVLTRNPTLTPRSFSSQLHRLRYSGSFSNVPLSEPEHIIISEVASLSLSVSSDGTNYPSPLKRDATDSLSLSLVMEQMIPVP
jgi:hypothetical protein